MPLIEMGPAEEAEDSTPGNDIRADEPGVTHGDRGEEVRQRRDGQLGHRLTEGVCGGSPAGPEDDRDVVLLDPGRVSERGGGGLCPRVPVHVHLRW